MFDQLLDSNLRARNARSRLFFAIAAVVYAVVIVLIVTTAVLLFNPGLVSAMPVDVRLTAVKLDSAFQTAMQRRMTGSRQVFSAARAFTVPKQATSDSPRQNENLPSVGYSGAVGLSASANSGLPPGSGIGGEGIVPGSQMKAPEPPPPPQPAEKPVERKSDTRVSEGVLQGSAVSKEVPRYPEMAKRSGVQGPVQVLITIDETGQVVEATVINGNPLLRSAALEAARRWRFSPTLLSRVAVRVQGVLTFDFKLNR